MKLCFALPGFALLAAILAACSNAPSAATAGLGRAPPAGAPDAWKSLAKDMTADQVRTAFGQPVEVRPMRQAGAEVWVYRRIAALDASVVPDRIEESAYFDTLTGQVQMTQNPVYTQEFHTVEEELQLLFFNGKLLSWKTGFRDNRKHQ